MDPHTAVAKVVADKFFDEHHPMLIASTAHYGKFGSDVLQALSVSPQSQELGDMFHACDSLKARPAMHRSLVESVGRPVRHHRAIPARVSNIVQEIKDFVSR